MDSNAQPVHELLKGCLKNDRKSQRDLYRHYYAYGMSICLRYANDREGAAEMLNDAFMKIFTNLKKFDLSRPFKPWLRRVLINTCLNFIKKNNISFTSEMDAAENQSSPEAILSGIAYDEVLDMIRKLSPAYRTVFNLYVIEGYKHEEIAEMLGISVGTSKSNLSKAKQQLRKILKGYFEEDYERSK